MVIAANQDNVFRRLAAAIGRPELAEDPKFATHLARGDNQEEIEGIVRDWAAQRDAAEIDRVLNEAGVICGPVYTIADVFADPHFREREMLLEHHDPDIGDFIGPGICPKFSETPGEVRWTGPWEEGSHNQAIFGGLLGLTDGELGALKRDGVI
jgi:crotonobetainyl-CoA:carnitine CoA-transferase CaiB-like acyl-CoA transferase